MYTTMYSATIKVIFDIIVIICLQLDDIMYFCASQYIAIQ